jgi:hypothetical protein
MGRDGGPLCRSLSVEHNGHFSKIRAGLQPLAIAVILQSDCSDARWDALQCARLALLGLPLAVGGEYRCGGLPYSLRQDVVDGLQLLLREIEPVQRRHVFLDLAHPARSHEHRRHAGVAQVPRDGHLG